MFHPDEEYQPLICMSVQAHSLHGLMIFQLYTLRCVAEACKNLASSLFFVWSEGEQTFIGKLKTLLLCGFFLLAKAMTIFLKGKKFADS